MRSIWRYVLAVVLAITEAGLVYSVPALRIVPFAIALPTVFLVCLYIGEGEAVACAVTSAVSIGTVIYPHSALSGRHMLHIAAFLVNSLLISFLALRYSSRLQRERNKALQLLKENQVRTQLALDGANAGIWDWDMVRNTATWSEGHLRLHGFQPGEVTPGYDVWRASLHPEDLQRVEEELEEARMERRPFESEYRVRWANGETRWIISQARYSYDSSGKAVRLTGVSGDITQRKNSAIALLQTERLAAVGRLAASIAHEINNPLEAMTNLLYLASHEISPGPVLEWVELAMKELERVSQIAHQTLRFSRAQGNLITIRASMLLESSVTLFQGRIVESKIDVERDYNDDPQFHCLPGDVRQIFANLVGNAIDAMPSGGRLVLRVSGGRNWRAGGARGVRISIADTGIGMTPETRRRIFEPFYTTKEEAGTGLGLWVLEQLVERHRGFVRVRSSVDPQRHGTVFTVFFPFGVTAAQLSGRSAA